MQPKSLQKEQKEQRKMCSMRSVQREKLLTS
jgi:hypothetical protein